MDEASRDTEESSSPLRLLCVEDSPADAELEAASLERAGYDVRLSLIHI